MSGLERSRSPARDKGNIVIDADAAISPPALAGAADVPKLDGFADQVWEQICPKMDDKLPGFATGFKEDVKLVVNSLVKNQVDRLEKD